jgi:hypothetical protein
VRRAYDGRWYQTFISICSSEAQSAAQEMGILRRILEIARKTAGYPHTSVHVHVGNTRRYMCVVLENSFRSRPLVAAMQ